MNGRDQGGAWRRYVAIGDSTTEGMDDPWPDPPGTPGGTGAYRGWADRFAVHLDVARGGGLEYANLAVRGRTTAAIRAEQVGPALALRPHLVTVVSGMNDLLRPGLDLAEVGDDLHAMQVAFIRTGATVVSFTLPDLGTVLPLARPLRRRLLALNDHIRDASDRSGALLLDLAAWPVANDPRLWSADRLHANGAGHERIAAALAHRVGLPGATAAWQQPLPPPPSRPRGEVLAAEWSWTRRHLGPWLLRRLRRRSSGDGITAKRPRPLPVTRD
ncbi:SGNH/GDSL hydrolase family protein [Egicoccus halophilus]|uniref:Lysophospholipase n=1 Tax=Egicoccus halophilus TaxID=1670830 RepID=A0A8J3AAV9_9ACTN|nr:SGNH/GDSL hydrolase family protein [Egicoccus halophilus]GGI06737.1 lysophospholipase [Egicoccus halophilus]